MNFKEYAQKIMQGCGKEYPNHREGNIRICSVIEGLCPECQRARQTAIDLGKMELELLEEIDKREFEEWESFDENWLPNKLEEKIKEIQEGLKILGIVGEDKKSEQENK